MATEIGKLIAIFEADTSKFDAGARKVETRLKAVKATAVSETKSIQDQFGISGAIIRKTADDFDKVGAGARSGLGAAERAIGKATAKLIPLTREQIKYRSELGKTIQAERASATGSIVAAVAEREVAAQARRLRAITEVAKIKGQTTRDSIRNDILLAESQKVIQRALDVTAKTNVKTAQVATQSSKQMIAANASVGSSFTMVGGAVAIATGAIAAAAAGILTLSTYSTRLAADVFDLSQKTNFSAETLSSLKVAAELSGGSFESLSTALGIFDRNMEEARQGGTDMSRIFKALKIDVNDNELALRQTFQVLTSVKQGSTQTALAMRLFGRSGKEVLGIIKETNGDIDAFIKKMREAGLVITSQGAKKADQFSDRLTIVRNKLEAVARQITSELIPVVSEAADDAETWLKRNQGELQKAAREVANLIGQLYQLAKVVASPFIVQVLITRKIIGPLTEPNVPGAPTSLESGTLDVGSLRSNQALTREQIRQMPTISGLQRQVTVPGETALSRIRAGGRTAFIPVPKEAEFDLDKLLRPSGGGGGGAKAAKDILEGLKNQIIDLNAETRKLNVAFLESANLSALAAEKEKILDAIMSSLPLNVRLAISSMEDLGKVRTELITLSEKQEKAFQKWYAKMAARQNLAPDPNDPMHQYDYRRAFLAGAKPGKDAHWPSEFKLAGHPNRFVDGIDTITGKVRGLSEASQSASQSVDEMINRAIAALPAKSRDAARALVEQAKSMQAANLEADNAAKAHKALSDAATKLREELHQTRQGSDSYATSIAELEKTLQSLGVSSDPVIQAQVREIQQLVTMLRTLNKERERLTVSLQTRPRLATTEAQIAQELAGITRPRVATVEEQVTRERIAIIRDQMQQVAFDITSILDRALYDGISGGAKRGLQSLTMGLLDMIQQVILGRLRNALTEALSGSATSGGGGGFLSGLFQSIFGSLLGIGAGRALNLGGGSTFTPGGTGTTRPRIVGRQSGGDIWPGTLYQVHRDEVIAPAVPGRVFNPAQMKNMGGETHIHIHVPVSASSSYSSKRSRRQLAEELSVALQGALN